MQNIKPLKEYLSKYQKGNACFSAAMLYYRHVLI